MLIIDTFIVYMAMLMLRRCLQMCSRSLVRMVNLLLIPHNQDNGQDHQLFYSQFTSFVYGSHHLVTVIILIPKSLCGKTRRPQVYGKQGISSLCCQRSPSMATFGAMVMKSITFFCQLYARSDVSDCSTSGQTCQLMQLVLRLV